jgi:hypothetical protein
MEESENKEIVEKDTLEVNSIFYQHGDDTSSKRIKLFILIFDNKEHYFFIKERISGPDMFYVPLDRGYLKIWKDKKGNILFYISEKPLRLFANDVQIWDTYNICDKKIKINGPLGKILEHSDEELEKIVKYIVCNKFDF